MTLKIHLLPHSGNAVITAGDKTHQRMLKTAGGGETGCSHSVKGSPRLYDSIVTEKIVTGQWRDPADSTFTVRTDVGVPPSNSYPDTLTPEVTAFRDGAFERVGFSYEEARELALSPVLTPT